MKTIKDKATRDSLAQRAIICQIAVDLHLINDKQFDEVIEAWKRSPGHDPGMLMVELGYISKRQYDSARQILTQSSIISFFKMEGSKLSDSVYGQLEQNDDNGNGKSAGDSSAQAETISVESTELDGQRVFEELEEISSSQDGNGNGKTSARHYTGQYTAHGQIGQGGLGRVILGRDRSLGREVAIKEILERRIQNGKSSRLLARFLNEARITGQLEHPGIVPVYELGLKPDGNFYYVMKYVRGQSMEQALQDTLQEPKPETRLQQRLKLLRPMTDVCEAMAYAHHKGVIHRDLKPANVIIGKYGENLILDWGLAKYIGQRDLNRDDDAPDQGTMMLGDGSKLNLTLEGEIMGTPSYMAPEQIDSKFGEVSARTDVYALGVMLFEILTGQLPYTGENVHQIMAQAASTQPPPQATDICQGISPELSAICFTAMSKNQDDRFKDAGEMARQLQAYLDGRTVSVYAYSRCELFQRFVQRNKALLSGLALTLLAIIVGAVFSLHYGVEANWEKRKLELAHNELTIEKKRLNKAHEESQAALVLAQRALSDIMTKAVSSSQYSYEYQQSLTSKVQALQAGLAQTADRLSDADLIDTSKFKQPLRELLETQAGLAAAGVIGADGILIAAESLEDNSLSHNWLNKNIRGLPAMQNLALTSQPEIGAAAMLFDERPCAVAVHPLLENGKIMGHLFVALNPQIYISSNLDAGKLKDNYQLWCLQTDGMIIYDSNGKSHHLNIFTDPFFEQFPELRRIANQMNDLPHGTGEYSYFRDGWASEIIHKIASWNTIKLNDEAHWKVVVVGWYLEKTSP
ncbi:protein kinase [Candidatus Sumerlaeota bacterium]|nr:protein kinase [Candidatus Sumerlaeota bacterium]